MVKRVSVDGYVFDFGEDVVDAFVFDSEEHHGGLKSMKAVDIIAEFPNEYLYIELKKYDPARGGIEFRCPLWDDKVLIRSHCPLHANENKRDKASVKRVASDLRRKYCDSFLFRYAEGKVGKEVNYVCVVEGCDTAQTLRLHDIMKQAMPAGIPNGSQWTRPVVKNVAVVNVAMWNAVPQLNRYGRCALVG